MTLTAYWVMLNLLIGPPHQSTTYPLFLTDKTISRERNFTELIKAPIFFEAGLAIEIM